MEFEQRLAKEKEGRLEKEKQLKINRLVQEVCCILLLSEKFYWKKMSCLFSGSIWVGHSFNYVKDDKE